MINEWVFETLCYSSSEIKQLFLWKIQCRDDLIIDCLVHESTDHIIMHTVSYDVLSCKVSTENERSMSSVQDTYFTLFVWFVVVCDQDWKLRFVYRELIFDRLWSFDYPESEDFSCVDQVVFVSEFFADSSSFVSWVSCYDTVNQCGTESIFFLNPCTEVFAEVPLLCIF